MKKIPYTPDPRTGNKMQSAQYCRYSAPGPMSTSDGKDLSPNATNSMPIASKTRMESPNAKANSRDQ